MASTFIEASLATSLAAAATPLPDIRVRDPFILASESDKTYYLYVQMGHRLPGHDSRRGVEAYRSTDLLNWNGPSTVYEISEHPWARKLVWAPEVHRYRDRYYLFVTLTGGRLAGTPPPGLPPLVQRGTQILHADSPAGPFVPFANKAHTPAEWMALDGTLWVEEGQPYMVFCHEWLQLDAGTVDLVPLRKDLSAPDGTPAPLFRATDASWVRGIRETAGRRHGFVTDGPFLFRTKTGKLLMIWSSFGAGGYALAVAESASGKLRGPWRQQPEEQGLLFRENGGHGMIFRAFDGGLKLTLHQPNKGPWERARLLDLHDEGAYLRLRKEK